MCVQVVQLSILELLLTWTLCGSVTSVPRVIFQAILLLLMLLSTSRQILTDDNNSTSNNCIFSKATVGFPLLPYYSFSLEDSNSVLFIICLEIYFCFSCTLYIVSVTFKYFLCLLDVFTLVAFPECLAILGFLIIF